MPHPKFKTDITKQELESKHYISRVEEFRRHIRLHKNIHVYYQDNKLLFDHLILALRKLYNAPNKDFSQIQTKLMIDKNGFTILDYKYGKVLELEAIIKGQLYNVKYLIKKSPLGYVVHYYDYSLTQKTLWGLTANLAKYYYKKAVKKNAKLIRQALKKLKGQK